MAASDGSRLATLLSFIIRDLLSRLVTGLTIAMAMAIFIWMDLSVIGVIALIGVIILIRFEKDTVLSHSWATTPGRINLTGKLAYRGAIWVVTSLLALFIARFPELGSSLTSWLVPIAKSLP